jgi:hypothetical protein
LEKPNLASNYSERSHLGSASLTQHKKLSILKYFSKKGTY